MSIRSSSLLGYNNNVRHRGKVFHIQTEDSGVKYGHIMTHLFADGGRILKSVKTSYSEYIGNERMSEIVREMMKQQHKAMFIALRDGKFDVAAELGPPPAPGPRAPGAPTQAKSSEESASPVPPVSQRTAVPPPPLPSGAQADAGPDVAAALQGASLLADALQIQAAREPAEEVPLDIDALERAAAVDQALPAQRSSSDLPPPPAKLLREKAAPGDSGLATPPSAARRPPQTATAAGERRYAPTRPASIFGQARPQHGKSIFGEDLMNDKSLDEVILSYLADDLDDEER